MGINSSNLQPQELAEFRKLNAPIEHLDIPARPENRTLTDRKGLIIFGVAILILFPFLIYALATSDIRRLFHEYDNCINFCGLDNPKIDGISCSGIDYRDKPYMNVLGYEGAYEDTQCVSQCPDNKRLSELRCLDTLEIYKTSSDFNGRFRRSLTDDDVTEFEEDFVEVCRQGWWKFLLTILITLAISVLTLLALRHVPGVIVWGVLIFGLLVLILGTLIFWYLYFSLPDSNVNRSSMLAGAIIWTVFSIVIVAILVFLFKKIGLVIELYKEATKALFAMPRLILVPVLTALAEIIILVACGVTTVWMFTSASLHEYGENVYKYEDSPVATFTVVYNIIITGWALRFVAGLQYLVVSGAVSTWYFAQNKNYLDSPISTSFSNAIMFHLGTVAFGSFILTLIDILKALIKSVVKVNYLKGLVEICCDNLEAFFKFLSQNAYIETAIHGQSFLRSGKRAAKLLLSNIGSVIAITSVGDFVLGMICFILIVITTGVSYGLFSGAGQAALIPTGICLLINAIIIAIIFSIFDSTIATLFICFCEDKVLNDGMSKPYFMSRGLMEFVENSKKIYAKPQIQ